MVSKLGHEVQNIPRRSLSHKIVGDAVVESELIKDDQEKSEFSGPVIEYKSLAPWWIFASPPTTRADNRALTIVRCDPRSTQAAMRRRRSPEQMRRAPLSSR